MIELYRNNEWQTPTQWITVCSGDIAVLNENELVSAGAAEDGCRIVCILDNLKKLGCLIHLHLEKDTKLIDTLFIRLKSKKISLREDSIIIIAGDANNKAHQGWNDQILTDLKSLGFTDIKIVTDGKGKDVFLNPVLEFIYVKNGTPSRLFLHDPNKKFDRLEDEGFFN